MEVWLRGKSRATKDHYVVEGGDKLRWSPSKKVPGAAVSTTSKTDLNIHGAYDVTIRLTVQDAINVIRAAYPDVKAGLFGEKLVDMIQRAIKEHETSIAKKQQDAAKEALAKLSPEQRAAVLAELAKGAVAA